MVAAANVLAAKLAAKVGDGALAWIAADRACAAAQVAGDPALRGVGAYRNVALGVLNEALGDGVPIVASPVAKPCLAAHPAFARSLDLLASAGVTFTATNAIITSAVPGEYDWHAVLDAVANRDRTDGEGGNQDVTSQASGEAQVALGRAL